MSNLTLPISSESARSELKITTFSFAAGSAFSSGLGMRDCNLQQNESAHFDIEAIDKIRLKRLRDLSILNEKIAAAWAGRHGVSACEALRNIRRQGKMLPKSLMKHRLDEYREKGSQFSLSNITIDKISATLFDLLVNDSKRKFSLKINEVKGVKFETAKNLISITVHSSKNQRCKLGELTKDTFTTANVKGFVSRYLRVQKKLERRPSTEEYRLHSLEVTTVADLIRTHIEFNVKINHGEDSSEEKLFGSLERLHLSRTHDVTLPNKRVEGICILNEKLCGLTPARFSSYMQAYEEQSGTHDKILTRLTAAFNFCHEQNLFKTGKFFYFHKRVRRISEARHVAVSDDDLMLMSDYLIQENFSSERMYREFSLFMQLEMTGHFRTQQTVTLKYNQIDFKNCKLQTFAKGGNKVTLYLSEEACLKIKAHRVWQKESGICSDCLFPSPFNSSVPRANFENEWSKMRIALGFFDTELDTFKYRLHDFRETLLTRIDDLSDPILSKLLGHTSGQALKHYREAQAKNTKVAAELAQKRLNDKVA